MWRSYTIRVCDNTCDKLLFEYDLRHPSRDILSMLIDSVALLGLTIVESNSLRRDLIKHRLPLHLWRLAKDVLTDSKFLFGDDIQKWIKQISANNSALQTPEKSCSSSSRDVTTTTTTTRGKHQSYNNIKPKQL